MSLAMQTAASLHSSTTRRQCPPPPPFDVARNARVRHWIYTGKAVIVTAAGKDENASLEAIDTENSSSATTSSLSSSECALFGPDNDALRPTFHTAMQAFNHGRETWLCLMAAAKALPKNHSPPSNISIMLQSVPALPKRIPKDGALSGHAVWRTTTVSEASNDCESQDGDSNEPEQKWSSRYRYGVKKDFTVSYLAPIQLRTLSGAPQLCDWPCKSPTLRGHLLLTLCWSYILSVQLYELQGKSVFYSSHVLQPQRDESSHTVGLVNVHIPTSMSYDLVPWLCAVLAPKPGWLVEDNTFTPWSALCPVGHSTTSPTFTVSTDWAPGVSPERPPPSCSRAMELLAELCELYELGHTEECNNTSMHLSPYTAAFLSALAIPFYRGYGLEPKFPVPVLNPRTKLVAFERIHQEDLRYYMTLSMDPMCVGSVVWSIFWQPDIECNVVAPWLKATLNVLRSALTSRNTSLIAQLFLLRRPRVALWWIGIFLLGNECVLDMIISYLETLQERWGYGSLASPDDVAVAWTGEPQSFLDMQEITLYPRATDSIPIAEVLRHRRNFRLQTTASTPLSWRPIGHAPKAAIELELWPGMEHGSLRYYDHWVWWIEHGGVVGNDFRKVKDSVPLKSFGKVNNLDVDLDLAALSAISAVPSIASTQRMLGHCMEEANGDQDKDLSIIPGAKQHTWLRDWRGFD